MGMITSLLSGSVLGIFGAIGSEVLGFFKERQKNKHELEVLAAQKEIAVVAANSAVMLEAYKALVTSYDADKSSYSSGHLSSVDIVRGLTRPVLTAFFVITACGVSIWSLQKVGIGSILTEQLADFSIRSLFNMAGMSVSWWFGSRSFEKMAKRNGGKA